MSPRYCTLVFYFGRTTNSMRLFLARPSSRLVRRERAGLAVADRLELLGVDAGLDQVVQHRSGALERQSLVVGCVPSSSVCPSIWTMTSGQDLTAAATLARVVELAPSSSALALSNRIWPDWITSVRVVWQPLATTSALVSTRGGSGSATFGADGASTLGSGCTGVSALVGTSTLAGASGFGASTLGAPRLWRVSRPWQASPAWRLGGSSALGSGLGARADAAAPRPCGARAGGSVRSA